MLGCLNGCLILYADFALSLFVCALLALSLSLSRSRFSAKHPFLQKTEMSAFDRSEITREHELARKLFSPHLTLIHLISSRYQAFRYRDPTMVLALVRLIQRSGAATSWMSTHPLAREARFSLIVFGFRVIQGSRLDALVEFQLREALFKMAFAWFASYPQWSHGSNRLQIRAEMQLMTELLETLRADRMRADYVVSSFPPSVPGVRLPGSLAVQDSVRIFGERRALLQLLVENELGRFSVWNNPLSDTARGQDYVSEMAKAMNETAWPGTVQIAWKADPRVAVQMPHRFKSPAVAAEVGRLVRAQPFKVVGESDAMEHLLADHLKLANKDGTDLRWLLFWAAVTPVEAIHLFQPQYGNHPMVLQYAMRALEQHPVELTFFYVPQVVQALRDDAYGYVEQFIFETSKISQLFCHQIIWNMKANSYKDDNAEVEDPMKPTLDRMVELIVQALSGEAKDFYEREFGFFNEVTSISGKLKPFIKKSKPEKKAKIDEEMAKIKVDPGVYLPSNPDGVVVDLDRKSGRPLQSHAKAPFMATFKVHRDIVRSDADEASEDSAVDLTGGKRTGVDVWQAAIFKVGDDCRQDVLALQVIAMFKNIFTTSGLDLYLNPYRVTATGPGCGVIDVVPNATSRDEMGRAKVNNLFTFFIAKYGNVDGIAFQKARLNFIQSMAAYSLACYILQIKDRHNGNIMIDGDGHIIHIDFGFLFDIGPGGVKFEPNSFKLNHEMIEVMGGQDSQGFRMFCELLTKAFLASRPYAEQIVDTVHLMLGTDLPSFKGEPTIDRLRDRFKLGLNERQAAKYMQTIIKDAYENPRSTFYDGFRECRVIGFPGNAPYACPAVILTTFIFSPPSRTRRETPERNSLLDSTAAQRCCPSPARIFRRSFLTFPFFPASFPFPTLLRLASPFLLVMHLVMHVCMHTVSLPFVSFRFLPWTGDDVFLSFQLRQLSRCVIRSFPFLTDFLFLTKRGLVKPNPNQMEKVSCTFSLSSFLHSWRNITFTYPYSPHTPHAFLALLPSLPHASLRQRVPSAAHPPPHPHPHPRPDPPPHPPAHHPAQQVVQLRPTKWPT